METNASSVSLRPCGSHITATWVGLGLKAWLSRGWGSLGCMWQPTSPHEIQVPGLVPRDLKLRNQASPPTATASLCLCVVCKSTAPQNCRTLWAWRAVKSHPDFAMSQGRCPRFQPPFLKSLHQLTQHCQQSTFLELRFGWRVKDKEEVVDTGLGGFLRQFTSNLQPRSPTFFH